jgi:hypothetical protein
MKRFRSLLLYLALMIVCSAPAFAQADETDWLTWLPADFVGALRFDVSDRNAALTSVNLNLLVSGALQPARTRDAARTFDSIFPVTAFDLEEGSFDDLILPWLGDQVVVGYRTLGAGLTARADETLLILPTSDPFQSLSVMREALTGQDLLTQDSYRGVTIYNGDETAFAFTPTAILIGDAPLIRASLDVGFGDAPRLTDTPTYQAVATTLLDAAPRAAGQPQTPPIFAYFAGDLVASLPRALFSTERAADALFDAWLGALTTLTASARAIPDVEATPEAEATPALDAMERGIEQSAMIEQSAIRGEVSLPAERALLSGAADAVGIALSYDAVRLERARADVVIHTSAPMLPDPAHDPAILEFVPRNALLVTTGAAERAGDGAWTALPLANFAGLALAAFPIDPSFGSQVLPLPTADDVTTALDGFITLTNAAGVNLRGDVLDRLTGSYVLALTPRPNNPTPALDTPFDALIAADVTGDSAEVVDALANTIRLVFGDIVEDETLTVRGQDFAARTASVNGEAVVRLIALDGRVLIATGDAANGALAAYIGDNRLVVQDRWTALNADGLTYFYADMPVVFNTFFPDVTGEGLAAIRQIGMTSRAAAADLLHIRLTVTLAL